MFTPESNSSDRKFFAVLAVAVVLTLVGLRLWANHLNASKPARVDSNATPGVLRLEAIEHVYECERDGVRVLTDRPCGTGVPVRVRVGEGAQ
jgi:hypothetical protein